MSTNDHMTLWINNPLALFNNKLVVMSKGIAANAVMIFPSKSIINNKWALWDGPLETTYVDLTTLHEDYNKRELYT